MSDWMFEVATTPQPTAGGGPALEQVGSEPWLKVVSGNGQASASRYDDGATTIDDVVVVGRRNSGSNQGWSGGDYDSTWFDWDGYDTNENAYQQEPPPPPRPLDWSECLDRKIDDLAEQAANIINRLSDSDRKEYGFLIWMDGNGGVQLSALIHGDNSALTGLTTSTPSALGFSSWSQVVGMVHSHPTLVHARTPDGSGLRYNADGSPFYIETTPDNHFDLPSTGDWFLLDNHFSPGNKNASMLRNYILYDNNLKEYDLYQNPILGNPEDRRNNSILATNENGDCVG